MLESVEFSLDYYQKLLDSIETGNYRFADFADRNPPAGAFFLRHDVDKDVECAWKMARLENELGIHAHYFFLLHSPLYSILEPESWAMISEINQMGHTVGLHCDERRVPDGGNDVDLDVMKDLQWLRTVFEFASPVVSFHNPSQAVINRRPGAEYISTYDPEFFPPHTKYLSESNRHFREGNPIASFAEQHWPRVQLLIHPIWWFDKDKSALDTLKHIVKKRTGQIDTYLRYSNHLWKDFKRSEELG